MRRRYDLVSQKNAKLSRAIDRWQIRRLVGTSGHTHQCCGGGCVPPSRALRSCSALPLWTPRVLRGSKSAWALRGRRWRCCPAIVIGQTFSSRADASIGGLMFGEHLMFNMFTTSISTALLCSQEHWQRHGLDSSSACRHIHHDQGTDFCPAERHGRHPW